MPGSVVHNLQHGGALLLTASYRDPGAIGTIGYGILDQIAERFGNQRLIPGNRQRSFFAFETEIKMAFEGSCGEFSCGFTRQVREIEGIEIIRGAGFGFDPGEK